MQRFKVAREAIAVAQTPDRVGELLGGCMSGLPNDWISAMPQLCQHLIELRTPDIAAAAMDLTRMEMVFTGDDDAGQLLREIAHTYAVAAARLASLQHR